MQLSHDLLIDILSSDNLNVEKEETVREAAMLWLELACFYCDWFLHFSEELAPLLYRYHYQEFTSVPTLCKSAGGLQSL